MPGDCSPEPQHRRRAGRKQTAGKHGEEREVSLVGEGVSTRGSESRVTHDQAGRDNTISDYIAAQRSNAFMNL